MPSEAPKKLGILLLNYEYPPLGGGAGVATQALLREFAEMPDLSIDVVTSSTKETSVSRFSDSITLHKLDIGKGPQWHFQTAKDLLVYSWRAFRYASRLAREKQFGVCHAFFGIPCGFIARRLKLPYIVSLRGSDVPFYNPRFRLLDSLIFRRLSRSVWKDACSVTALSESLRQLALKTAPDQPISVMKNGIDTVAFSPPEEQKNEKEFRIVFVGRLIERKGLAYALDAFALIADRHPHATMHVAGDGPLRPRFEKTIREKGLHHRVVFHGRKDRESVIALYRSSHAFVLPSLNEALSNCTLEAMACGLPVVCTRTGAAELIDGNGLVVAQESSAEIAAAFSQLISDPARRMEMGKKSRALAMALSWREAAERYRDLYRQCSR